LPGNTTHVKSFDSRRNLDNRELETCIHMHTTEVCVKVLIMPCPCLWKTMRIHMLTMAVQVFQHSDDHLHACYQTERLPFMLQLIIDFADYV
jgi:hypothetical protein